MAGLLGALSCIIAYLTTAILVYSPSSFLDTNRPVHLATATLAFTSAALLIIAKRSPSRNRGGHARGGSYDAIPMQELPDGDAKIAKERQRIHGHALTSGRLLLVILIATAALALRVEILRRQLLASECSARSVQVWLPFLVAAYDALRFQKRETFQDPDEDDISSTAYSHVLSSLKKDILSSRGRYLPAAFLFSLGCHLVTGLWTSSPSTIICPLVSPDRISIPQYQSLALLLDAGLLMAALELYIGGMLPSSPLLSIPTSWAIVTTLATGIWLCIAIIVKNKLPEHHAWLFLQDGPSQHSAVISLAFRAVFLSTLGVSALYSIMTNGLLHMTMALTGLVLAIPGLQFIWSVRRPYPSVPSTNLTWSFVLMYIAWSLFNRTRRALHKSEASLSRSRRTAIFVLFSIMIFPGLLKSNSVHFHPIDLLMYDAQSKHARYITHASQSQSLADAVKVYQNTYQENPPPGFDKWHQFAADRGVLIKDEFNQIYNDLLPFRAISPADLRTQTWEMTSNPWNEISGISIRNGKAEVQENVIPTHRWMLEGVVHIIETFSEHLPDMDLAFNLNDECRVAVPYKEMQALEDAALGVPLLGRSHFSEERALGWKEIPPEPTTDTIFENWSFQNTFRDWAARACPPNSAAWRNTKPLAESQLCLDCAEEHSLGIFLANWSAAADPCHQPDLANLHGLFLSPAAFKGSHQLRPVFSQSKAMGFDDILYPSAWNYMDKVKYDPTNTSTEEREAFPDSPFSEKQSALYWRGATSEGVSAGFGAWRGMTRQRMVHMANNLTSSPHDMTTLLLPDQKRAGKYTYTTIPGSSLPQIGLQADVHFVNDIVRCGGRDCDEQALEFGLVGPQDFQKHWQYKYLIDLDGAGFSGRFLPFLQSQSLPLKAALFREWYDSRLVPWLHFVPLDLRLHGLWSTLAYFSGVHGIDSEGRNWDWSGHQREAELIAKAGSEWTSKALTKGDMEVYFFRLLLEWGRLTDDRRDELGYTMI